MGTNNISNKKVGDIILQRFLLTLGVLLFIRIGTFLPVPGINHSDLAFYIQRHSFTKSLVSTFSGDNTFVIGLFTLNIFPYINASILIQLILGFYPKLSKLQKEGDPAGRRTINRLTRLITLIWAVIQSASPPSQRRDNASAISYTFVAIRVVFLTGPSPCLSTAVMP